MPRRASVTYAYPRLGFRAELIEPLRDQDVFRVDTPEGSFQMSKAEFYRVFANVVASASYKEGGLYHYPATPGKAGNSSLTEPIRASGTDG